MSTVSQQLLNLFFKRRTIRRFSSKPVPEEVVQRIVEAGQRAPTACNLQTYSVIWVRDDKLKNKVLDACKISGAIREAPIIFVICADVYRLSQVLDYLGHNHCFRHGHGYLIKFMSIMDACFVAENMTMAAECLGLGSVYIGSAFANDELIETLKLPENVIPLTLLCVGYPNEQPPTRPRWPLSSILHIDSYKKPTEKEMKAFLEHMNYTLEKEGYYQKYANRESTYHYSDHIQHKTIADQQEKMDLEILSVLKKMRFLPS
jgi:nitroreductase